ncbi:MAG TPA: SDR family oxidoreductase [Opitutales bacterium]|nr:SDR family oxidoreductase [Opitutales bacterium]
MNVKDQFDLSGRVAVITGGAGLLGVKHAEAVAELGAIPVLADVDARAAGAAAAGVSKKYGVGALGLKVDITRPASVKKLRDTLLRKYGRVDILINNAARNPKVEGGGMAWSRLENYPLPQWELDLAVGLTGALVCSQILGAEMARAGRGVILNIASDLGVIAPDQRIYRRPGLQDDEQPAKPVSYSVVKHGLIGLTKYLATYWAEQGVRANSISPGGVFNEQDQAFVRKLTALIPLGRMARPDEYKAAVAFLVSDASQYMTGANLVMDGGRSTW